jgi:hypothetical protein
MPNERATTMRNALQSSDAPRRTARRRVLPRFGYLACVVGLTMLATACSLDSILKRDALPPDVSDPAITETPAGAVAVYHGLVGKFRSGFGGDLGGEQRSFISASGLLTDELQPGSFSLGTTVFLIDQRAMLEGPTQNEEEATYGDLQAVRGQATQAIGLLSTYAPEQRALLGHSYLLEAYAETFLAELFCSGIPLTTLDYDGDYTLRPGSSTADVYAHALALLDTASTLLGDSARFVYLEHMARARVLLDQGDPAAAASAAADVPDGWVYAIGYHTNTASPDEQTFAHVTTDQWGVSASNREGQNGLDYGSSRDPRTTSTLIFTNPQGFGTYHPDKYPIDGSGSIVLASGLEARLIEAEAQLQAGDATWLATLNALRTDGTFDTQPDPNDAAKTDTLWHAGTGGTAGLAPLADPGTAAARVDLLFRERAFWLYLTGHRQADLRRLVKYYGRSPNQVYPTGAYPVTGMSYGADVTVPIPDAERIGNPKFTGCISRGA